MSINTGMSGVPVTRHADAFVAPGARSRTSVTAPIGTPLNFTGAPTLRPFTSPWKYIT